MDVDELELRDAAGSTGCTSPNSFSHAINSRIRIGASWAGGGVHTIVPLPEFTT